MNEIVVVEVLVMIIFSGKRGVQIRLGLYILSPSTILNYLANLVSTDIVFTAINKISKLLSFIRTPLLSKLYLNIGSRSR